MFFYLSTFDLILYILKGGTDAERGCVPVPKTGNLSDPNKWRGVMLMDVCSKIFSLMMNARAFKLLTEHGTWFQFGGTSELECCDFLFLLKTMLNMEKNHNLPS
jgi:hypothetical protein